ncbi:uncharacterized protein [Amphiura filiformis]|uniref:uncharacterized protein n=1 Tax=Amphiura filiformis TaxID=82378 RepID=UPI003B2108B3
MSDVRVKEEEDEEYDPLLTLPVTDEAKVAAEIDRRKEAKKLMTTSKDAAMADEEETNEESVEKEKISPEEIGICKGPQTRLIKSMEDFESCPGEMREEFERCQRKCQKHEAKVATDIENRREAENSLMVAEEDADEMTDEEKVNEESVPLRTCPFAEKEKITLDVVTDFVFEEIRKPSSSRKLFGELVEDVVNAVCQHNSVKLKKTPRLMHQVKKYVSELVGKKRKGKRDQSSSNIGDIDMKHRWECMVLADEFECKDDFERCQRRYQSGNADQGEIPPSTSSCSDLPEETSLHVEPYFLLKQIKNADTKFTYQEFMDFIFQQICSHKSVTLHGTPRLKSQVRKQTAQMKSRLKTEGRPGGYYLRKHMDNIGRSQPWTCKVLADEFVYREEFERCRREAAEYDAQVQAEKDAEMANREDINEESVPLQTCPFAEKEKINLDVVTDFVFEEIRKPNSSRKLFGELVEDVVNTLCRHNSVRLKTTPRLLHQVKKYVSELVGKGKKGKGKRAESSSNVEDIYTQQPWECMVLADEFESRDDFVRCQRMCEDTNLHVEPYFLLKQIKYADAKFTYQELIDFIFQQICSHKSVTLHGTPRLKSQVRKQTAQLKSRLKTEGRPGGYYMRKYMDNVGRYPPWTCKVLADEFVYREEFERCRREAAEYDAQVQAEKEEKRRLAMEDEERKRAEEEEDEEESLPLRTYPLAGTTLESKEEDVEGNDEDVDGKDTSDDSSTEDSSSDDSSSEDSSSDDSSSEDSSSDDSSDTDSLETHRKRKRKKKRRKWIRCPYCKWKFQKEIQLDLHIQWHLKHVCCTCGLTFATKSMLKEHRNNAHQVKTSCGCRPLKNKRSKRFKKLKRKHVCQLCGKAYDMLYLLRKHRSCAFSINLNSIKCCICYHGYKSPADLRHHKEVFHPAGYKLSAFHCKRCKRHFSEFQKYRSHVKREQKKYRKICIQGIRKRNSSPQEGVNMINQSTSPQTLPNSVTPNILYHSLSDTQRITLGMAYLRYLIHQQSGNNEHVQSMNGIASNALSNMARRTSQNSPQPPWINVRGPNYVPTQVPTQGLPDVGAIGIDSANIQPHTTSPVSINSTNVQQEVVLTLNASVNSPNVQPQGLPTSSVNNNSPNVQPQGLPTLSLASDNSPNVQPQGLPTVSVASDNSPNVQYSHTPSFIRGPNHVPTQVSTEALPHVGTIGIDSTNIRPLRLFTTSPRYSHLRHYDYH